MAVASRGSRPGRALARAPGLMRYFEADAIPGLAPNDPIVTWPDLSPYAGNITQGTASKRGTWVPNALNGHAVGRFDGSDDCYVGSPARINGPFSLMVVCIPAAGGTGNRFMVENGESGTNNINFYFYINAASPLENGFHDGATFQGFQGIVPTLGAPMVCSVVYTGSILQQWRNGVLSSTSLMAGTTPTIAGTQLFNLGSNRAGIAFWNGDVALLAVCAGAWTNPTRKRLERAAGAKYAIGVAV